MSTEIKRITGKCWDNDASDSSHINPKTYEQVISLNRFFGGLTFGGRAMQVTIGNEYVMLSPKQAWELGNTLVASFKPEEIFPSE